MAHRTDSITIHDVIKFLQGFDINDRFLTVVEKEDGFNYICRLILPLIFRHASQSKLPPHGNSLPRIQRIQKIAALEGIFPKLSSSPKYATTSRGPLLSEQSATPDRNESPEHNTTLEDSRLSERSSTSNRDESPERNATLEDSQSSEQSSTPDCNESPEHNTALEDSLSSEQSATSDRNETQESTSPQQCTSIAANTSCADSSSPPADGYTPTALMLETVPFQDSAIELSDSESEKNSLSSSSPQAIEHGQITPGDPKTTTNQIPTAEGQDEDETPDYTTLASTIKISLRFPLWSNSPESFWNNSEEALDPKDYGLINPKVFVKDALDQKSQLDTKTVQNRFYSILICKLYEKVIASPRVIPALVKQFLNILGLPSDSTSESYCTRLIHGGQRRKKFCRQLTPDGHKTDYSVLLIPELENISWEQPNNKRLRDSYNAIVDSFEAQNISSWSKSSGAQSAANSIISSRQPLLDHFQTQCDNIQGQKRRVEFSEDSSFKRIRSNPTTSPPNLQSSRPNIYQNTTALYPNFQNSSPTISPPAFNNSSPFTQTNPTNTQPVANKNANQSNICRRVNAPTPSAVSSNICLPGLDQNSPNARIDIHAHSNDFGNTNLHLSINQDVSISVPSPDRSATGRAGDEQAITCWDGQQSLFLEEESRELTSEWDGREALHASMNWNGGEEFDTIIDWMRWEERAISRGFM